MRMQRTNKKSLGFTLLELLVVISIIGILIAISAAAFTTAQQKARNAKRQGDINSMAKAFEQYYATSHDVSGVIVTSVYANDCGDMMDSLPGSVWPTDPKTGVEYSCTSTTSTYCACAELEPSGNSDGNATNASCAGIGTTGSFYCVQNQQ